VSGIWREQQTIVGEGLCLRWRDYAGAREQTPVICLPGLTRNGRAISIFGGVLLIMIGLLQVTGIWNSLMIDLRSTISEFTPVI